MFTVGQRYKKTTSSFATHHGRNVKRLREILGVKQEIIAAGLNISQQAMSKLEKKEQLEEGVLEKIAEILNIPVDAIETFSEEAAVNIIANTFHDSSFIGYNPTFNPVVKLIELYERLLKSEQEKNSLLQEQRRHA
ncbi:MAG: helix-turn-helix domain-containing protein [Dysgonamonadaceae bacterium]|nr:helix-turn-helix domain-containing protein [Dysgonamonadaceae bacterium]